ncbi:hypothetical protein GGX14DRAFT_646875 [Mycena pura]|uniref:Uncharacterized protein n=1 Tax=Mycena pura TaxID=153505 RepID=A0AAD6V6J6_9AGAR|nr:hypothetical protein GGX14DRAFT_646875 [Mycena pura]
MAFNTNGGTDKRNGSTDQKPSQITSSIESDLAELNELLSKDPGTLDDLDEASVEVLLARLEGADGVAKGVENKLDALLGNLDSLLAALENNDDANQSGSIQPPASEPADNKDA